MNNRASGTIEIPCALKHDYYIPSEILNLPNIFGSDIEREASILRDGFESRTNGMFDRERGNLLESIPSGSPLYPWKLLIHAVSALYDYDTASLTKYLSELPEVCGPGLLKNILSVLGDLPGEKEKRKYFSRHEKHLYNLVSEDRRFVKSMIMQLNDNLDAGEDYFIEFALLTIREIRELNEEVCYRFTLWCLNTVYNEDFDYTFFLDSLKTLFPPALVMRFSALILTKEDPEEGIKCWLLSLIFRIREGNLGKREAAEYLLIISQLMKKNIQEEEGETDQILQLLHSELSTVFRLNLSPVSDDKPSDHFPSVWAAVLAPEINLDIPFSSKIKSPQTRRIESNSSPLQLELFGEVSEDQGFELKDEESDSEEWDFTEEITENGLLSPRPLESPEELKNLLRSRPRYVGPEPWLEIIIRKRRNLIR